MLYLVVLRERGGSQHKSCCQLMDTILPPYCTDLIILKNKFLKPKILFNCHKTATEHIHAGTTSRENLYHRVSSRG